MFGSDTAVPRQGWTMITAGSREDGEWQRVASKESNAVTWAQRWSGRGSDGALDAACRQQGVGHAQAGGAGRLAGRTHAFVIQLLERRRQLAEERRLHVTLNALDKPAPSRWGLHQLSLMQEVQGGCNVVPQTDRVACQGCNTVCGWCGNWSLGDRRVPYLRAKSLSGNDSLSIRSSLASKFCA